MRYAAKLKASRPVGLERWRALVLFSALTLGLLALIVRSAYLQVVNNDFLQEKGEARYSRIIELSAHRGKLVDRDGIALAISTPVESVWASPPSVKISNQELRQLANILEMSEATLMKKLKDMSRDFVYLKRQLPPEQIEKVVAMKLPGISLMREYRRYYPIGEEASHILGFTGRDDVGREGLELLLQSQLAGQAGSQSVIKDRRGRIVEDVGDIQTPKPGTDFELSIDSQLQHIAYREIKNAVTEHNAKAGAVVVLDAHSGEVLALANYPSYNPNNRSNLNLDHVRNRAVTDLFEPGSTMKPFAVAAALEKGKVRPTTVIDTEKGLMVIADRKIRDSHPEDRLNVAQIIQKSSNIGSAKIALMMTPEEMWQKLTDSGFGETTGSGFPGEVTGRLKAPSTWRTVEQATISYGHGMSVNLLQLARAYTVFANNGDLLPVTFFKQDKYVQGKSVFSPEATQTMLAMMETVTMPGGTAPRAQVPGYRVAGKTGTAHKLERGRYVNKYIASFVGVAPVSNPRLVIAVMVDEPRGKFYYGGQVAAPVFSKLTEAALHALNIPNDAPLDNVIEAHGEIIREEV